MRYEGWLRAAQVLRLPGDELDLTLEARIYSHSPRRGTIAATAGPFAFVVLSLENITLVEASTLEELLRLVVAKSIGEGVLNRFFLRSIFAEAGLEIDEGRLAEFESALKEIAELGNERLRRRENEGRRS